MRIGGGILAALCAEPAIAAFARAAAGRRVTVSSAAADLYVGHPQIDGILYSAADAAGRRFEEIVELKSNADDPLELAKAFAHELSVAVERYRPKVHVTSMDRLRVGRFGLRRQVSAGLVIILPEHGTETTRLETLAADIEERLGTDVIYVSAQKYPDLEHGQNLTGRLLPREMMTILDRAACWVGLDGLAAAMGWAAGKKGIVLTEKVFKSPDETISVRAPVVGRETLLEAVSELFENDREAV
jgi:hypothetical protein